MPRHRNSLLQGPASAVPLLHLSQPSMQDHFKLCKRYCEAYKALDPSGPQPPTGNP